MSQPRIKHRDPAPRIPYTRCRTHGRALGYVSCVCLDNGTPVGRVVHPTADTLGEITCGQKDHPNEELVLTCIYCAKEMKWIPETTNPEV